MEQDDYSHGPKGMEPEDAQLQRAVQPQIRASGQLNRKRAHDQKSLWGVLQAPSCVPFFSSAIKRSSPPDARVHQAYRQIATHL
jgi:hypothetical protein